MGAAELRHIRTASGSTVRIDRVKSATPQYAIYFHCQTDLVETFRELYPDVFKFEKNRAIVLDAGGNVSQRELRHCIGLALTYHSRKRKSAAPKVSRPIRNGAAAS